MYEQLTVGEIQYRHKLLSVRPLSKEALDRKAQGIQPGAMPSRLRENTQGEIIAFVCRSKTTLFYHLPIGTKEQKNRGQQIVFSYAKSLAVKAG